MAKKKKSLTDSMEAHFQNSFLTGLFIQVLNYVINPNPEFHLTTEFKNQKINRKVENAILKGNTVLGVVELKGYQRQ